MSEEPVGVETEESAAVEARKALATVLDLKDRAEAALAVIEEVTRKANSESGFAFNAKQNSEDHAKAISQIRGAVDADANWLTTTKRSASEAADAIAAARTASETDLRRIGEAKAFIETHRASTETAAASVDKLKQEASAAAKEILDECAAAKQTRTQIESSAVSVVATHQQVSEASAKASADATQVSLRATESQHLVASILDIADKMKTSHERVTAYEQTLMQLTTNMEELHTKIEALLPGATSAGLASAFRDQKSRFDRPQGVWGESLSS